MRDFESVEKGKNGRPRTKAPVTGGKSIPRPPSKDGKQRGKRRSYPR